MSAMIPAQIHESKQQAESTPPLSNSPEAHTKKLPFHGPFVEVRAIAPGLRQLLFTGENGKGL